jgi:hypothetical protein
MNSTTKKTPYIKTITNLSPHRRAQKNRVNFALKLIEKPLCFLYSFITKNY